MAKDGSHYWVLANVTPSYDRNGEMTGFLSVRRKPRDEAVKAASTLYQAMLEAERKAGAKDAIAASSRILTQLLAEKGVTYEEFVLSL